MYTAGQMSAARQGTNLYSFRVCYGGLALWLELEGLAHDQNILGWRYPRWTEKGISLIGPI